MLAPPFSAEHRDSETIIIGARGGTPLRGMRASRVERVTLGRLVLRACVRACVRASHAKRAQKGSKIIEIPLRL